MEAQQIPEEIYQEAKAAYLKAVVVPVKKSDQQFFLCPVGFVGAGKSTVLGLLCEHFDLVRLSSDEIRKFLRERGYGKPDSEEPRRMFDEVVEKFASAGYSIAFDSNCGSFRAKEVIEARARRLGAKIFWIHVNPPEEFILEKLRTYKHTWLFRDAEHAISRYFWHKEHAPHAELPFFYTFDTSRSNLSEQAERCVVLMRKEIER